MRTRAMVALVLVSSALLLPAVPAQAAVVSSAATLQSGTSGIVLGPDGNLWVAEEYAGSVAQVSPAGAVVRRFAVGGMPSSVTTGPGGRVWVAGAAASAGAPGLVWIDATSPTPTTHVVANPSGNTCPAAGIVAGGGRIFFSLPSDGTCNGGVSAIASVPDDGTGSASSTNVPGPSFDLAVSGGQLYAPDYDNDAVRRYTLSASPTANGTYVTPAGSQPAGITVDGAGNLWVSAAGSGKILTISTSASPGSTLTAYTPTGGTLQGSFGIVALPDGGVWVAGKSSNNLARLRADGTTVRLVAAPGSEPFDLVLGPGGDVFATDQLRAQTLRIVDDAPRVGSTATSVRATAASVTATVDARGNDTQVAVDYGTSTAYGASSAPTTTPAAPGPGAVSAQLTGLRPGTTYHVRVRATNALGVTLGSDTTFTTPARVTLTTATASGGRTRVSRVKVVGVAKGDKVTVRCRGGGCTRAATVTTKVRKSGRLATGIGVVLVPGARLTVTVTVKPKAGARSKTVFTMVKGKKPKQR